jgi:hypothetical protein
MASSKRTTLAKSMTEVWANMQPGATNENLLRPIRPRPTSGPLAPLPGSYNRSDDQLQSIVDKIKNP